MQDVSYAQARLSALGTWNADANPGNLGDAEFTEVRNLRQSLPGQYDVRSNYKDFHTLDSGSIGANFEVICQCEYRYIDTSATSYLFDVVVYQDGTDVKVLAINRKPIAGTTYWATQYRRCVLRNNTDAADLVIQAGVPTVAANPPVEGFATQYGSYIAVTLYDYGVFLVYPVSSAGASDPDTWSIKSMGKSVANTPYELTFADTYEGDLFLIIGDIEVSLNSGAIHRAYQWEARKRDPDGGLLPLYEYERIPMGAPYYIASNTNFDDTDLKLWQFHKNDPNAVTAGRSLYHLQARGWGYRFVFVRKYTDARGNVITYRTAPSTDCWVPNRIYSPPQCFDASDMAIVPRVYEDNIYSGSSQGVNVGGDLNIANNAANFGFSAQTALNGVIYRPSQSDMQKLGEKFIKYHGKDYTYSTVYAGRSDTFTADFSESTGFDESLWIAFMYWVGFRRMYGYGGPNDETVRYRPYRAPYFTEVPASELASAPLTKFRWKQFSTTDGATTNPLFPTDTVEIEIYRTAFNESDGEISMNGIDQPLFQPHLYGYVGSIKKPDPSGDTEYIDDTKDEEIDFGFRPEDESGFLEGNMSGKTITVYKGKIVIGDISMSDGLLAPWQEYQCFLYGSGAIPATALSEKRFYLQYIDSDGNVSGLTQLTEIAAASAATWGNVVAVIPQGYAPNITAVRFIYYDGANYRLVKVVQPEDGYVIATATEVTTGGVITTTTATDITVREPGTILWSKANDPYSWPGLNYLAVHPTAPVTAMHQIIGELWVWTDRSTALTDLGNPLRFEIENEDVGCVGRFVSTKIDKIVFFLSASGMYFAESSGIVQFPAYVQSLVEQYTTERIASVEDMKNVRRTALGWLSRERELWFYIPGSNDIGGTLRARLIVYKFFNKSFIEANNLANISVINYEFELLSDGNLAYSAGTYDAGVQSIYQPLILTNHSDGKLFACFKTLNTTKIHTMDVDNNVDGDFAGTAYLEKAFPLGSPGVVKLLRSVSVLGDFNSLVSIRTGAPRIDNIPDYTTGLIWSPSTNWAFSLPSNKFNTPLNHRVPPTPNAESTSYTPLVRLQSSPNGATHDTSFKGISVSIAPLHNHRA